MSVKKILRKIDTILCAYLGLERESIQPTTVKIVDKKLFIVHQSSFKRHNAHEPWDCFSLVGMKHMHPIDQQKLGIAVGKAIAKKLIVSFEETPINRA